VKEKVLNYVEQVDAATIKGSGVP